MAYQVYPFEPELFKNPLVKTAPKKDAVKPSPKPKAEKPKAEKTDNPKAEKPKDLKELAKKDATCLELQGRMQEAKTDEERAEIKRQFTERVAQIKKENGL